ncbi:MULTISPECIES: hypothetical protein [Oerskovia]|uniref:Uncharacterized protein n=2 Tax=Oerskovia TaxID=162491 RepID=A0ABR8UXP1_9CELL|nr:MULTISPECIES: hypothetical protein [Oerskovia]MBD7997185.1 hypothetical protein [Oerskovia gallyi]MBM7497935.1 hypothetical protein [Oerskovia paurometabola]
MDIVELVMRVVVVAALVAPLVVMALRRPPVGGRFPAGTNDGWSLPPAGRGDPRRQVDLVGARGLRG